MSLFSSLYTKLVLVLFLLFVLIGAVFLTLALYTAPMYQQEVSQQINHDLARYIVKEHVLIENGEVRQDNLAELFHNVMIINPGLELYLLDADGKVIAHSMEPERVMRKQVSLQPIEAFLAAETPGLIMGDDPGNSSRQYSFSAAPIEVDGMRQGYIYAILGGEKISNITHVLQRSLIMRWSSAAVIMALLFAFIAALILFFFLMRKLRGLSQAMQQFKDRDFNEPAELPEAPRHAMDEIDSMATTFREMSQRIHQQLLHLQETEAMRRELVANVSHDLRTPLSSLSGFLETLQIKSASLSESEKQAYLKIAYDNTRRLSSLVEELFELAKLDANEVKPQQERFSMAELAFDVAHKFYLRARDKRINFELEIDETLPLVMADVGMIERVLDNLIDNSLKHTPGKGQVRLQVSGCDGAVQVAVSDTGFGIAEEEIPFILKRFYRNNGSAHNSEAQPGLGLGLAIASRIVEMHGSHLSVASVLHQGTTIGFSLPAQT